MLPDVTVPAPVVTFACVIAVRDLGRRRRRARRPSRASSWMFSCICCTPESVTACTPSMACRRGTTRVPSSAASCSRRQRRRHRQLHDRHAVEVERRDRGRHGRWSAASACTPEIACWTSASLAFMSVPNSYSIGDDAHAVVGEGVELLDAARGLDCLLERRGDGALDVLRRRALVDGEHGEVREREVGDQLLLEATVMAKAPNRSTARTARPTIERLRREIFVSQLKGCLQCAVGSGRRRRRPQSSARSRGVRASGRAVRAAPPR